MVFYFRFCSIGTRKLPLRITIYKLRKMFMYRGSTLSISYFQMLKKAAWYQIIYNKSIYICMHSEHLLILTDIKFYIWSEHLLILTNSKRVIKYIWHIWKSSLCFLPRMRHRKIVKSFNSWSSIKQDKRPLGRR